MSRPRESPGPSAFVERRAGERPLWRLYLSRSGLVGCRLSFLSPRLHPDRRGCTFIAASCGSRPDRSKILPNVISAYCEKLYAQARAVFGFHLCIHARARTASRRSRHAATLRRQRAFGSPNGAHPRTSGAGSTTTRSRSQHRSAACSRVAPGPTLSPFSTDQNRCAKPLNPATWSAVCLVRRIRFIGSRV